MTGRVVVVGSINQDISVACDRLPGPGETLLATALYRGGGGKGANQAVAAARSGGAHTSMVGAVGRDADGAAMRAGLEAAGVDCAAVAEVDEPTGTALITVDPAGENTIVVAAGANAAVRLEQAARSVLAQADVVVAQLEVSQQLVVEAARLRRDGMPFILNAAPSARLSPELAAEVDLLVVNEHEAHDLARDGGSGDGSGADGGGSEVVAALLETVPAVLLTLGERGAHLVRRDGTDLEVPAHPVVAVDATGAGDTFCGVLAAALAHGEEDRRALELATAAASLAVERRGAQDSMPTRQETVERAGGAGRG